MASRLALSLAVLAFLFLALPIVALVIRGVQNQSWSRLPNSGIPEAIWLSFITTLASMALTILFGTPLAYVLARRRFPFKRVVNLIIELPIVLPPAVAGLAMLLTFGRRGLLGAPLGDLGITLGFTTYAVILVQTFVAMPFYVRAGQLGFQNVPREVEDAARVDGTGGFRLFWSITLPLSVRAISAGLILAWARALGEFGATILFAGSLQGRTQTMPLLIYNVIERDINAAIWTGLILVGFALLALLISQSLSRRASDADTETV